MAPTTSPPPIPVFLLKSRSSPTDAYEDLFTASTATTDTNELARFEPTFVPVLEHRFDDEGIARLADLLKRRQITNVPPQSDGADTASGHYGGLIFTSQRAVEAFSKVVSDGDGASGHENGWPHLQDVPIYSVGPATTRALGAVVQQLPLQVFGEHTGNGEDLAYYIRGHYAHWKRSQIHGMQENSTAPPPYVPALLFVVGEKRRDIIPRVLMGGDKSDSAAPRIQVDEIVVYGTGVMPTFAADFQRVLDTTQDRSVRWVVVFSPTGCDSMLAALGLLDSETGRARKPADGTRSVFVATIGPTTRSYLQGTFGFDADVCADEPSPQGILYGILQFMAARAAK
ncbi:uroporphyrinogen-III synthase [Sporothrix brasiliensis 5110]|uniref:Uroporphyrinogen-III synthase n=1 Tax=Sporothrix brasiliensis 5110 TaxID=1398154 RepID=A0A0C2IQB2_9PEZI|nr:uroporphyrinogen-III synthase [Sporothrix brasiliensis 5110]KIH89105.1 uroporphyrinogen-III synthase [Sporothrix brasiliensis 5110]